MTKAVKPTSAITAIRRPRSRRGTIFHASKLPLRTWFQAMFLMSQSKNAIAALELKRNLGVCYRTVWLVKHKLMQVMAEREAGKVLEGRVEADDAYLGGEREGKRGRGSENKIPFIAAVQTDAQGHPLRVGLSRVKTFSLTEVQAWVLEQRAQKRDVQLDVVGAHARALQHRDPVDHQSKRFILTAMAVS